MVGPNHMGRTYFYRLIDISICWPIAIKKTMFPNGPKLTSITFCDHKETTQTGHQCHWTSPTNIWAFFLSPNIWSNKEDLFLKFLFSFPGVGRHQLGVEQIRIWRHSGHPSSPKIHLEAWPADVQQVINSKIKAPSALTVSNWEFF